MIRILPGLSVKPMLGPGDRVVVVTWWRRRPVLESGVYLLPSGDGVRVRLDCGPEFETAAQNVCRSTADAEDRLDGLERQRANGWPWN